ncbi:DUF1413 domain-containing protein [Thioclava sp. GXIMD4216]|uniref:DUF1413 domain-containing protein n=1 Tax=Thioclava litoralis TaxID=3076557 RepID=A0ABZ1DVX8_9RHOB|nr:DUF1413 domain-containing protein [Thioclava sp. FTW29]
MTLTDTLHHFTNRLTGHPQGPFHLHDIYGPQWAAFSVEDKLRLGRDFLIHVRQGAIPQVHDSGQSDLQGRVFVKG